MSPPKESWPSKNDSFTGVAAGTAAPTTCLILLEQISTCEVGNRPGRIEPRVLKRRLYGYKLMQEPRHIWKDKLVKGKNT